MFAKVMASAGVEAAVQLDKEVNLVPIGFSHHPYVVRCVSLSLDMSFEVDLVVILNEKGAGMPTGSTPQVNLLLALGQRAFNGLLENMAVNAWLFPAPPTEQLPDRHAQDLAHDIP